MRTWREKDNGKNEGECDSGLIGTSILNKAKKWNLLFLVPTNLPPPPPLFLCIIIWFANAHDNSLPMMLQRRRVLEIVKFLQFYFISYDFLLDLWCTIPWRLMIRTTQCGFSLLAIVILSLLFFVAKGGWHLFPCLCFGDLFPQWCTISDSFEESSNPCGNLVKNFSGELGLLQLATGEILLVPSHHFLAKEQVSRVFSKFRGLAHQDIFRTDIVVSNGWHDVYGMDVRFCLLNYVVVYIFQTHVAVDQQIADAYLYRFGAHAQQLDFIFHQRHGGFRCSHYWFFGIRVFVQRCEIIVVVKVVVIFVQRNGGCCFDAPFRNRLVFAWITYVDTIQKLVVKELDDAIAVVSGMVSMIHDWWIFWFVRCIGTRTKVSRHISRFSLL